MLSGYVSSIVDQESRKRYMYMEKLQLVNGIDPYEIGKEEWKDNVDLWPAVTHVHVCICTYLLLTPYSEKELLNYKSLDSYIVQGWVGEV